MSRKRVLKQFGGGPRFESGRSQPDFFANFLDAMRGSIFQNDFILYSDGDIFYWPKHDYTLYVTDWDTSYMTRRYIPAKLVPVPKRMKL